MTTTCEVWYDDRGARGEECGKPAIGRTLEGVAVCLDCEDDDILKCVRYLCTQGAIDSERRSILAYEARSDRPLDTARAVERQVYVNNVAIALRFERTDCLRTCRTAHIPYQVLCHSRHDMWLEPVRRAQVWHVWLAKGDSYVPVCARCGGSSRRSAKLLDEGSVCFAHADRRAAGRVVVDDWNVPLCAECGHVALACGATVQLYASVHKVEIAGSIIPEDGKR